MCGRNADLVDLTDSERERAYDGVARIYIDHPKAAFAAGRQTESVNDHPSVTGRDRSLQGRRSRMADADR